MIKPLLILSGSLVLTTLSPGPPPLVFMQAGKLHYGLFANEGQTDAVNRLPDFSYAGYQQGGVSLPTVPVKATVQPARGDCQALIQRAIDQVSALPIDKNGFRGAVLLKAGVYPVGGSLDIRADGVVIRGEGNEASQTVLIATQSRQHDLINLNSESAADLPAPRQAGIRLASDYVPTGARSLAIADGRALNVGDRVLVRKTPNDVWIDQLAMRQYGWKATDYQVAFERTVVAISGNQLTLDIPLVDPIDPQYGGGEIQKITPPDRLTHCGVENLRIESVYASDTDENHCWNAIALHGTENCWVRDVVAKYTGLGCVFIQDGSVFNTVADCAMIDPKSVTTGGRKYSFNLSGSSVGNLFQRCVAWGGRHDYVTGSRVPGPNVFLDCVARHTFADVGPHHRWSTGVLFDNIDGGQIRVQNRKAMGSGHGWAGAQTMFWNCRSDTSDFKVESPLGARNWAIGCTGLRQQGNGLWENWGTPVTPRSLYLQQLQDRLGPQAVANCTTARQRQGRLWPALIRKANTLAGEKRVDQPKG